MIACVFAAVAFASAAFGQSSLGPAQASRYHLPEHTPNATVHDKTLPPIGYVDFCGRGEAECQFKDGKVEALAGLTQGLLALAPRLPGSRLVEGRFMGVQQSIAVPKGKDAGLHYLRHVVEDAKKSGLVARAIDKTGAKGVSVAPLAK